ncbi:MAG: VCBS repeat-containing protein [Saprospiraceae bacterium]
MADFDMDGDVDIVIGNVDEPNAVYQNYGDGTKFFRIILSEKTFNTYKIKFADLNNDTYPEIIESNSDELNVFYLNLIPFLKKD